MHRLILLFAFAGAAFAAEVRLGAETPLTPLGAPGPAAYQQADPSVASNGHDFYAVWFDSRDSRTFRSFDTGGMIYGMRLDWQGRPLEPFGRVLATEGMQPVVASNGDGYLVLWRALNGSIHLLPLDRNGEPAGPERTLPKQRYPASYLRFFGSNGATYVLIGEYHTWAHGFDLMGHVLDGEGNVIAEVPLPMSSENLAARPWTLGAREGIHELLTYTYDYGFYQPLLMSIDDGGRVIERRRLTLEPPQNLRFSAAAAGARLAMAWTPLASDREFTLAVFEQDGTLVRPAQTFEFSEPVRVSQMLSDGTGFLLLYYAGSPSASSSGRLSALHLSAEGEVRGGPWVLSEAAQQYYSNVSFASNGSTLLLLWRDFQNSRAGDLVARAVRDFSELAGPAATAHPITLSGEPQTGVDIAVAKSRLAAVWYDEQHSRIRGVIDGKPFPVDEGRIDQLGPPAIAMGEDNLLVAWAQQVDDRVMRIVARRYAFDGTPLDAQPLVLAGDLRFSSGIYPNDPRVKPSLAPRPQVRFDGSSFVAALYENQSDHMAIRIARVDPRTGAVTASTHPTANRKYVWTIAGVGRIGSELVVPYCAEGPCFLLRGARHIPLRDVYFDSAAEIAEDRVTIVTYRLDPRDGTSFPVIRQLTPDGALLPGEFGLPGDLYNREVTIAWNGTEYVAVFTERNRVRAIRLTRDLQPLDTEPFDVSPEGSPRYFQPRIAATRDGVIIAYSRTAEENGRAPRLFTRTLERLSPLPERRRGVRH